MQSMLCERSCLTLFNARTLLCADARVSSTPVWLSRVSDPQRDKRYTIGELINLALLLVCVMVSATFDSTIIDPHLFGYRLPMFEVAFVLLTVHPWGPELVRENSLSCAPQ